MVRIDGVRVDGIWVDVVWVDFSGRVANTSKEEQATIEEQIKITGHNHPEKNFTDIGMRRKNFTRDNSVRSFIIF